MTTTISMTTTTKRLSGQALFNTPGSSYWTAPADVYNVSVVCIGGGAAYTDLFSPVTQIGGGGGGLGWKNGIAVVPGVQYLVEVGAGGNMAWGYGGDSFFINSSLVAGFGGQVTVGGGFVGDGGGKGGDSQQTKNAYTTGGGGAGGYAGDGGRGGGQNLGATDGQGGGGGGGAITTVADSSPTKPGSSGGGGTGVLGQGSNGKRAALPLWS